MQGRRALPLEFGVCAGREWKQYLSVSSRMMQVGLAPHSTETHGDSNDCELIEELWIGAAWLFGQSDNEAERYSLRAGSFAARIWPLHQRIRRSSPGPNRSRRWGSAQPREGNTTIDGAKTNRFVRRGPGTFCPDRSSNCSWVYAGSNSDSGTGPCSTGVPTLSITHWGSSAIGSE
jgi:hypothetical protein